MDVDWLAQRFEANGTRLQAVAYRMLGSASEADDAVQEAWLRLSRADTNEVENLSGWLTTVVARVCLDILRSRKSRREEPLTPDGELLPDAVDLEHEAVLAESVGSALLVVLQHLAPAERVAFVLHDHVADLARHQAIVEAFFRASHGGDFEALLSVLDPDVSLRRDETAWRMGVSQLHGAPAVAEQFTLWRAQASQLALIDGVPGAVWATRGRPRVVFAFTIEDGRIIDIELVADRERLRLMRIEPLA